MLMLSVAIKPIMLSVLFMLNVVLLNVVAPVGNPVQAKAKNAKIRNLFFGVFAETTEGLISFNEFLIEMLAKKFVNAAKKWGWEQRGAEGSIREQKRVEGSRREQMGVEGSR